MAKVLDCDLEISEFELHSHYEVYFGTNTVVKYEPTNLPSYALNSINVLLQYG